MDMQEAIERLELEPRMNKVQCPRHVDDTGSLHLYDDHGYCFSCGWNGDAYGLIAVFTNQDVKDVLRNEGGTEKRASRRAPDVKQIASSGYRRLSAMSDAFWTVVLPYLDDLPEDAYFGHIDHWSNMFQDATHDLYDLAPFEAHEVLDRFEETLHYGMETFAATRGLRRSLQG